MNNIITLDQLAAELAQRVNIPTDDARAAILALEQHITAELTGTKAEAEIPHIGTFRVTDVKNGTVVFDADRLMAETLNEPFSFFEPVQLYTDQIDSVETDETPARPADEPTTEVADEPLPETVTETKTETETEHQPEPEVQPEAAPIPVRYHYTVPVADEKKPETPAEQAAEPLPEVTPREQYIADDEYEQPDDEPHNGMSPLIAYILGILTGMILMCVAVYFLYPPLNLSGDDEDYITYDEETVVTDSTETSIAAPADEVVAEPTTPTVTNSQPTTPKTAVAGNKVITDTVSSTNYLAIMARKYYGNTEFWVYIYKENEAILGHPDRVPAGTVVVIPPASKYGIDANDPESIKRAKKLNGPIYAPYRK